MEDAGPIIFRALQSALAGYGALYIVSAICWPSWFLDTLAVNHVRGRFDRSYRQRHPNHRSVSGHPWYEMPMALVTLLAIGVLVFAASYAIISVVPYSWGSENEDGEWEGARQSLQYMIAFIAPLGLVGRLEANAEVLASAPAERQARRALTDAIRFARHISPEANQRIAKTVDEKLKPEDATDSFAHRYAADLRRWVDGDLRG